MEILRESLREYGYDEIEDLGVVYDMMFPYRKHKRSLDKLSTCIDINRQLKDLCANQNKYIILAIAKFLEIPYDQNTPLANVCGKIQTQIMDICLTTKYKPQLVLHWGIGSAPHVPDSVLCSQVRLAYRAPYVILSKYVFPYIFLDFVDENKIKIRNEDIDTSKNGWVDVFEYKVNGSFEDWPEPMTPKYKGWFEFHNLDQVEKLTQRDIDTYLNSLKDPNDPSSNISLYYGFDTRERDYIKTLAIKFKQKSIPIDITWDQLCAM